MSLLLFATAACSQQNDVAGSSDSAVPSTTSAPLQTATLPSTTDSIAPTTPAPSSDVVASVAEAIDTSVGPVEWELVQPILRSAQYPDDVAFLMARRVQVAPDETTFDFHTTAVTDTGLTMCDPTNWCMDLGFVDGNVTVNGQPVTATDITATQDGQPVFLSRGFCLADGTVFLVALALEVPAGWTGVSVLDGPSGQLPLTRISVGGQRLVVGTSLIVDESTPVTIGITGPAGSASVDVIATCATN